MIAFTCQGCGKSFQVDGELAGRRYRCKQCGVVARIPAEEEPLPLLPRPAARPTAAPTEVAPKRAKARRKAAKAIDRDAVKSLAIGAGLAVAALVFPLLGFVPAVLMTVIHELGHVATSWFFGCPALPSFDLTYGGGVSHRTGQVPLVLILIYGVITSAILRARGDRRELLATLICAIVYTFAAFSPLREFLIVAMGHGMELTIAGIFLYRALSGSQILRGSERPLYAFVGLFIVLADARFAYQLMSSRQHRDEYGDAKGGGHWMDFSRLADEHLHMSLQSVAVLFLLACLLTPPAAFLVHRARGGR